MICLLLLLLSMKNDKEGDDKETSEHIDDSLFDLLLS